jgi:hypothetical protein
MAPRLCAWRFVCCLVALVMLAANIAPLPVMAAPTEDVIVLTELGKFASSVANGNRLSVVGVYAPGRFAFPIVQQPYSAFVSKEPDTVTQYALPWRYGVIGLLGHNSLSGNEFFKLRIGDRINLIYGDGRIVPHWVTDIQRYRATIPESEFSQYVDLRTGRGTDGEGLFRTMYTGEHHLTLQTCIEKDGQLSWGRLFVIAETTPPRIVTWALREPLLDPEGPDPRTEWLRYAASKGVHGIGR